MFILIGPYMGVGLQNLITGTIYLHTMGNVRKHETYTRVSDEFTNHTNSLSIIFHPVPSVVVLRRKRGRAGGLVRPR